MSDKKTKAHIYLLLRQIQEYTYQRGVTPSSILKKYDSQQKGYVTFNEFEMMLQFILASQYHGAVKSVWDFITEIFKQPNLVTGDMFDKIIKQVCDIDNQQQKPQQHQQDLQVKNNQDKQQNQQAQVKQSPTQPQNQFHNQQQQNQQHPYVQQKQPNQYQQPSYQTNLQPQLQPQSQPQLQPYILQQPGKLIQPNNQQTNKVEEKIKQPSQSAPQIQQKNLFRSLQEIFKILTKSIQNNQTTLKEMFQIFDQDCDKYLNLRELEGFFFNIVPQLTEKEFQQIVNSFGSDKNTKVSLFHLMRQTQEGNAMINSIKMNNPPPVEVKTEKQVKVKKDIFSNVSLSKNLLESNIYENPQNRNLLTSKINFEEYFVLDQNTPGLQNFIQTFGQLKQMGQQFVDQRFPAQQISLGGRLNSKVQAWKRPKEIWQNQAFDFFVKDTINTRVGLGKWISPSDIIQGELGDCYFLASISSIACRRPDAILDLFVTRKLNPCGMYCVRINVDGQWKAITVDDFFPTRNGRPIFTQSKDRELWVMVLEKAWAKIFGGYLNIEAGIASEVMRALTGAPTKIIMTSDQDFLKDLEKCCQEKCIMVSGSYALGKEGGLTQTYVNKTGLISGHAYSILKIREIVHPKLGQVKLLKLRNPWAEKEWQGDWSDKSSLWTPEIKKQLNYTGSNEGVFYMDVSSFIQHFSEVSACMMRPNYKYRSEQILSSKKNSIYFALQIETPGEYFFTVTQKNQRFKGAQDYSPARIVIGEKVGKGKYKLVTSCNKHANREIWCTNLFKAGVYMIQIKINWQYSEENTFNFSCYGQEKVGINQVQKIPDFIRSMFMNIAQSCLIKKHYEGEPNIDKCYEFPIDLGHGYFFVENRSNKYLESVVDFKDSTGIKLCKPERGQFLKISLGPGKSHLSIFTISPKGYSYSFQEKLTLRQI